MNWTAGKSTKPFRVSRSWEGVDFNRCLSEATGFAGGNSLRLRSPPPTAVAMGRQLWRVPPFRHRFVPWTLLPHNLSQDLSGVLQGENFCRNGPPWYRQFCTTGRRPHKWTIKVARLHLLIAQSGSKSGSPKRRSPPSFDSGPRFSPCGLKLQLYFIRVS